jgi:hypothetical protein
VALPVELDLDADSAKSRREPAELPREYVRCTGPSLLARDVLADELDEPLK